MHALTHFLMVAGQKLWATALSSAAASLVAYLKLKAKNAAQHERTRLHITQVTQQQTQSLKEGPP